MKFPFVYCDNHTPINLLECKNINPVKDTSSIIFWLNDNSIITWNFDSEEKRDRIFRTLMYHYGRNVDKWPSQR